MAAAMCGAETSVVADGLVSVAEACEFLGVSRSSLYVLMDKGSLKYCKIGGARRVPRRALVELAERSLRGGAE
jgi:excisionase family DNA binding protein